MHLRPSNMVINTHGLDIGNLPRMKTAVDVMGDFLRYLYMETIKYIKIHHSDSSELLVLSIQHVSAHAHSNPSRSA